MGKKDKHSDRPGLFYKDPVSGEIKDAKVCFGTDVLVKAGINNATKDGRVILEQDQDGNCIVSLAKSEGEGLPAGSYTIRSNIVGKLMRVYFLSYIPSTRKIKFNYARLASIVLPVIRFAASGKEYLLLTQRVHKKRGSYNDIWVFPGGHVEKGETFAEAASRETFEETGVVIPSENLKSLCCWQEFMVNKKHQVQFLINVFTGVCEVEESVDEEGFLKQLNLQEEEVASAALVPKGIWDQLGQKVVKKHETSHYSFRTFDMLWDSDDTVEQVLGLSKKATAAGYDVKHFDVTEIVGKSTTSMKIGVHGPHKFGIRMLMNDVQADFTSLLRRN